jgi:uncharacterized cysteine cluster protein YcgN (CxxCxxCC family)
MKVHPGPGNFWKEKKLPELTAAQWESLCNGCGKCCLHKLQDAETGDIYYTAVACRLLDIPSCRCRDYTHRMVKAPYCLTLTAETVTVLDRLSATCTYRLVAAGKDLPTWHHLMCGDRQAVHAAGMSVCNWALSPEGITAEDLKNYIVRPEQI